MIVRIVHMAFRPETLPPFLALFEQHRDAISGQPGCTQLQLVQDPEDPLALMTISTWDGPEALDAYRGSALFGEVWPATKRLFSAPPRAQTLSLLWAS